MKKLIVAAALLATSAPAFAGSFWIAPSGHYGRSPTYTGLNATTAALSAAWANDSLVAGDTCLVAPGTYGAKLEPRHTGTPSQYIVWVGNVTSPASQMFTAINIDSVLGATRCISVKGVGTSGDLTLKTDSCYAAGYDSISYCEVRGRLNLLGRPNVSIHHCTIGTGDATDKIAINNNMPQGIAAWDARNPSVHQKNYQRLRTYKFIDSLYIADNTFNLATTSGSNAASWVNLRHCQVLRNRFTLRGISNNDSHLNTWYGCSYNTVTDNYFDGASDSGSPMVATYLLNCRDNFVGNVFARDTLVQNSASAKDIKVAFSTAGNNRDYGELPDSSRTFDYGDSNNTFSACHVFVNGLIEVQSRADNNKYLFNTLVTNTGLLLSGISYSVADSNVSDSIVFRHNTVYSGQKTVISGDSKLNNSIFAQNILVSGSAYVGAGGGGHYGFAKKSSFTKCDSNLVWCTDPSDSLYAVNLGFLSGGSACKVGTNSTWGQAPYSYDRVSVWGDPQLTDSTITDFTFDPRPNPSGIAYSSNLYADGYAGAIATPADVTAPVVTITGPTATRFWSTGEDMPLTWTATDAVGITSFAVQWNRGASPLTWRTVTSGLSASATGLDWTLPTFVQSYATVRVLAYDAAGNVGTATLTFRCDVPEESDMDPSLFPE